MDSSDPATVEESLRRSIDATAVRINALLIESPTITLATAESCTGGNVAAALTSVAGSSAYFLGGVVPYSNAAKNALLGVSNEILADRGAVSAECAQAMAEGARARFGADVAVSTTGIAGPGGGTPRKPVGTVFFALADPDDTFTFERHFAGDRQSVIHQSTVFALTLLEQAAMKLKQGITR